MSRFALCTLTVGALSLILTLPTEAEACSCITPTIEVVAPADGAVDVPTNARLWVGGIDSGPSLMDASGTEVPGTVSSLRSLGGIVRIFTPDAPLTPGAARILKDIADKPAKKRVGLALKDRAPAREGTEIAVNGEIVGVVTSGGFGPTVGAPIAMGFVRTDLSAPGTQVDLMVRGKARPAEVVKTPFAPHRFYRG